MGSWKVVPQIVVRRGQEVSVWVKKILLCPGKQGKDGSRKFFKLRDRDTGKDYQLLQMCINLDTHIDTDPIRVKIRCDDDKHTFKVQWPDKEVPVPFRKKTRSGNKDFIDRLALMTGEVKLKRIAGEFEEFPTYLLLLAYLEKRFSVQVRNFIQEKLKQYVGLED